MEKVITGIMVYYYEVCKRKLWYHANEISMESGSDLVAIGKMLDEESYKRDTKHINIDNTINIDFIRTGGPLHEIKKSNKIEEASILQVKYYLYYLKKRGVYKEAVIDYPLLKQRLEIKLSEEDEVYLEKVLDNIKDIIAGKIPVKDCKKNICKSCAFFDLCYI